MKKHISIFLILFLLASVLPAFAEKEMPPEGGAPKDFRLPVTKSKTLENGLGTVLVQYGQIPKATVSVIVKTGNIHEGPGEVWLADLTAQLMREGTASMNFEAIARKAATMGGSVDVTVTADDTTISGDVLSEHAPELVKLIADVVMNPAFPASEMERIKNDLKRRLNVEKAVPQNQAREKFLSLVYKDHAYGRLFPTEEMLNSYTVEKARAFYTNNYGAQRARIYVAGKFAEEPVAAAIESSFGKWAKGPAVNYPAGKATPAAGTSIIDRPGAPQTTVMIGLPMLDASHPDAIAMRLTNALLGGSFGSRITRNIREDKGYTYSPSSTVLNRYRTSTWFELADVTSEHTADSVREIKKEIARLQSEPPSAEELKGIQNYMAGIFVIQNSAPSGIISLLHYQDLHGLDDSYLANFVKNVYAVQPAKAQQLVKDHLKIDDMTLVMVGDKKLLDAQFQQK